MSQGPFLTRITVDLVTEEPLGERRQAIIAAELSDNLHTLGVEQDDGAIMVRERYVEAHEHDTTQQRCTECNYHSRDHKNGAIAAS